MKPRARSPTKERRQAARRLDALPDLLLPTEVLEVLRLEAHRPMQTIRRLEREGLRVSAARPARAQRPRRPRRFAPTGRARRGRPAAPTNHWPGRLRSGAAPTRKATVMATKLTGRADGKVDVDVTLALFDYVPRNCRVTVTRQGVYVRRKGAGLRRQLFITWGNLVAHSHPADTSKAPAKYNADSVGVITDKIEKGS